MRSFAVFAISTLVTLTGATDYCDPKICQVQGLPPPTYKHVACGFSGKASSKCTGYIELTNAHKQIILEAHNKLRNKIASGQQPGFPTAVRMATMKWHDELTYIATVNAFNCDFEHDKCRNTDDFKFAGQNLAMRAQSNDYPETNWALEDSVNGWFAEVENATAKDTANFTGSNFVIGHFTQVVNAFADSIGCAATKYKITNSGTEFKVIQLTCNYSRTNIVNQAIYVPGKTASECKTGTNPKYSALCSEKEEYDANYLKF